jgi:AcrR family transcriptional regulator
MGQPAILPLHAPTHRERKKAATRERIYLAALDLFRRKGFGPTTVDEVAAAADVSRGTFFNYFPSKESLLYDLGERMALEAGWAASAALHDPLLPTRRKLSQLLQRLAEPVQADPALARAALFELLKAPAAIVADPYRKLLQASLTDLLAEGQRCGEVVATLDAALLGSALAGAYLQQLFEWCAARETYPLAERLDQILSVLWDGLGVS